MTEEGGGGDPQEMRQRLIERSTQDEGLRQRLLEDPKGTVEQELGARLPEEVEIRAVEETPEIIYLVLPPKAAASLEDSELSERDLDAIAGGYYPEPVASYNDCGSTRSKKACDPLP